MIWGRIKSRRWHVEMPGYRDTLNFDHPATERQMRAHVRRVRYYNKLPEKFTSLPEMLSRSLTNE